MSNYVDGHARQIYRCPGCGLTNLETKLEHLRNLRSGGVAIMCWDECGMDFERDAIWWYMNSWRDD
jgi:hypothetical protein